MEHVQTFTNFAFGKLELIEENGKVYFPATDVAKMLGYRKPHDAITRHCKEMGTSFHGVIDSMGRSQSKKFINEGNLYRLITNSNLPHAEQFESWVFDEVLPDIRKHGMHATPQTVETMLNNPDTMIELLQNYKEVKEKHAAAELQIEQDKTKVLFADAVDASQSSILVGELAKLISQNGYSIGQNKLFEWLRENGFLSKRKGESYNLPTQRSMDLKIMDIKKRVHNNPDGSIRTTRTPKITGKGQQYFINKFLSELH